MVKRVSDIYKYPTGGAPKTQEAAVKGFHHQLLEENNPVKSKECSIKDLISEKHLKIAVQTIKQMNRFPACTKSH